MIWFSKLVIYYFCICLVSCMVYGSHGALERKGQIFSCLFPNVINYCIEVQRCNRTGLAASEESQGLPCWTACRCSAKTCKSEARNDSLKKC